MAPHSAEARAAESAQAAHYARRLQQIGNTSSTFTQFLPSSILVLRLGGADTGVDATIAATGVAVPVSIDSYSVNQTQTVLATTSFPTIPNQYGVGNNPCTLASGSSGTWLYDADGMPSNTQVRRRTYLYWMEKSVCCCSAIIRWLD